MLIFQSTYSKTHILISGIFELVSGKTLDNGTIILVNPCSGRGLYCKGKCVQKNKICDGVKDCSSGADEQVCPTERGL